MDVRQLRCFMAVAELLSFSKAAERLGMTQPGISYQVASLEQSLGLKLIARSTRVVHLTPAGLYFSSQLLRLCSDYQSVVACCRVFPGGVDEGDGSPEAFLDIRQLRYFLEVVRCQNFTRAGEASLRTQAGISYQIAALEKSLGRRLFQRGHHSVSLTEVGNAFSERVSRLMDDYERVLLRARELEAGGGGSLSIGFLGGVLMQKLPGIIREFSNTCPGVRVNTVHLTLAHMFDAILSGEIDCGFALVFDHVCPPGIQSQVVLRDRMVAVLSIDHPLASRKRLRVAQLKGQTLLSLAEEIAGPGVKWHQALCTKNRLDCGMTEYAGDFPSMFMAIGMGRGIAIQPGQIFAEYGDARLLSVPLEDAGMDVEFVVAWKAEGANPLLDSFLQCFNRSHPLHGFGGSLPKGLVDPNL